jgi:starch phosphorylase
MQSTMFKLRTYTVVPALPEPLARIRELAYNVWWSWNGDALELFRRLDPDLWNDLNNNPIQTLAHLAQRRLDQLAVDRAYLAHLSRVLQAFDTYMTRETWFSRSHPDIRDTRIAYFSMEFGLHESLPFYSGGLGVLAGDHLKSASDLGLPLVGVGLAYRQGYFQQRVSNDGWQVEEYPSFDYFQLPMTLVKTEAGETLVLSLPIGDHEVKYILWRIQVGRVPLYLMDTDLPENIARDRDLTHRLYGGDDDTRIRQELLLGIGGLRALKALKLQPDVCHMNEGHAAFMTVERIIQQREQQGLDFGQAREAVAPSHVFTTHTPIPAGIDRFDKVLLVKYLTPYLSGMGLSLDEFAALGKRNAGDADEPFSMAIFALRLCGMANGVSALHGHVSREMWHDVWPGAPRDEVPITSITNGIHTGTWIASAMADLLFRYLGPLQIETPVDHEFWRRVDEIPDLELWRTHEQRRVALVAFARMRLREQLRRRGAPPTEVKAADEFLDPEALTIGFARRFAPYKRGALLFKNPERLAKILGNPDRPVQFIFAGKAHPRDDNGKAVLREIIANTLRPEFRRRIIFLENYEFSMARMLVQGCDVWLNNPIKPREASGTSGMKVSVNGGINLSVLDGWWPEAYDGENGWTIDEGRIYDDTVYRDHVDGESIYDLLEKEIVPLFYDRTADGVPSGWVEKMKASMRTICPLFNTNRMIQEYAQQLYVPAAHRWRHLTRDGYTHAKGLSTWKHNLAGIWSSVRVDQVEANDVGELPVGSKVQVRAKIHLGSVKPDDVAVELYHGRIDPHGQLLEGSAETMNCREHIENGSFWFDGQIPCTRSGQLGYAIRVVPKHPDLVHRYDTGLICWG